ncbi:hypothetical protein UMZ34_02460 [Halopseudomonas pachastrellae]|nr:hypothetical protein UMZ34_02460 [Halopseudomonas pachastrellae]
MSRAWQPSATIDALRQRARIINQIRQFFAGAACWRWIPRACHTQP